MKKFHLLLPEEIYVQLRAEAKRAQAPAASLAGPSRHHLRGFR